MHQIKKELLKYINLFLLEEILFICFYYNFHSSSVFFFVEHDLSLAVFVY